MLGTLCTLITALTCVSGVTVVTQKPPVVTVRKGDTATMDCNLGTVENNARWYKQVPGGVPQYMLRTKLIVTDGDLSTPAVTLFPPSTEDLKSSRATLVCLASNLSQRSKGFADVSWMSNGESVTEDVSTSPAEQQPDKTFKISSYLTIQTAEWDKDVTDTDRELSGVLQGSEDSSTEEQAPEPGPNDGPENQGRTREVEPRAHSRPFSLSDCLLKYLLFFSNLLFTVLGLLVLALGLWGLINKESFAQEKIGQISTDPMLVFVMLGLVLSTLCLSGCVGALRENCCLLQVFSATVLVLVVA
ncbi:hypothetical protein J4Q44_G00180740 [Coregonus suidteri]|uniref:Ig-like domain-containing protein n=1 Tax=Coregonus suidteri TaxID=861788 RepID=A0AAN8QQF0_9TELE